MLLAAHSLAGALGGYMAVKLEKRYKEKLLLYIVPVLLSLSFWIIQIDALIFVPFVVLGFLDSVLYIVLSDYINKIIPSDHRATVLSFSNLVFSIVMICIFPLLGALATYVDFKFSFLALAILVTILNFALLYVLKSNRFILKKD